jgi:hypothetical protein
VTVGVLAFCEFDAYAQYDPLGDPNCGQLSQPACLLGKLEWGIAGPTGCDRGLKESSLLNAYCVNDTRESIPVDNWPSRALRLQRELQADLPFHKMTVLNSHNAFNSKNDRYDVSDWSNQKFSITDQLNMGVRSLSLDVHWAYNALRLCHSGEQDWIKWAGHAVACSPTDRPFHQIIEELAHWMRRPENRNEVVFLDMELYTDGRDADLEKVMSKYLGDLWLHPSEFNKLKKPDGTWPTLNDIRKTGSTGRRVVGFLNYGSNNVFGESFKVENKDENAKNFDAATCSFGQPPVPMYPTILGGKVRYGVTEDSTTYPFYESGRTRVGVITTAMLRGLTECNVTAISLDQISLEKIQAAVWSWDIGQPDNVNDEDCTEMWGNGRWNDVRCDATWAYACYNSTTKTWNLTSRAGAWQNGSSVCEREFPGSQFSVPRNGYENKRLADIAKGRRVWLNLSDRVNEGSWKSDAKDAQPLQMPGPVEAATQTR